MATLKQVAEKAGVSLASASHALSGSKPVSAALRDRVLVAAREVGYVPHRPARALRTGRSRTLGVLVPDLTNPYFPALVQAIETAAREADHGLLVVDSRGGHEAEADALARLAEHRVDGIVWVPGSLPGPAPGLPAVTLDRPVEGCDSVSADHAAAGRLLAEHLQEVGRRRPVLLHGPLDLPSARARREGFLAAWPGAPAFEAEVPFEPNLPHPVQARLIDAAGSYDAVVAANDAAAIGVLRVLRRGRLRVPDGVTVVGVDDIPWAELVEPALTTVRQPVRALGREAVRLLLARIERPDLPARQVTLPVRLVARASSPKRIRPPRSRGGDAIGTPHVDARDEATVDAAAGAREERR